MKRWRIYTKVLLIIAVVLVFVAIGVFWWIWGGYERTAIPNELVPTAEYLMKQPVVEPSILNVFPRPGSTNKSSEWTYVCLHYDPQYKDREKLSATYNWTRVYLNGQRLPQSNIGGTITGACLEIRYVSHLPSGLYLLRIQVAFSFNEFANSDPKLSYEWAYRVE